MISLEECFTDGKKPASAEYDHPINTYNGEEYPLDTLSSLTESR